MSSVWSGGGSSQFSSPSASRFSAQLPLLTPAQAAAIRKRILEENLAKKPTGSVDPKGFEGALHDIASRAGLGGALGGTVDKALAQIADVFIMAVPSMFDMGKQISNEYLDIYKRGPELGDIPKMIPGLGITGTDTMMNMYQAAGKQYYTDVRHPIRQLQQNPGYLALDIFGAASLGTGAALRGASAAGQLAKAKGVLPRDPLIPRGTRVPGQRFGSTLAAMDQAKAQIHRLTSWQDRRLLKKRNEDRAKLGLSPLTAEDLAREAVGEAEQAASAATVARRAKAAKEAADANKSSILTRMKYGDDSEFPIGDSIDVVHPETLRMQPFGDIRKTGTIEVLDEQGKSTGIFASRVDPSDAAAWGINYAREAGAPIDPVWAIYDVHSMDASIFKQTAAEEAFGLARSKGRQRRRRAEYDPDQLHAPGQLPFIEATYRHPMSPDEIASAAAQIPRIEGQLELPLGVQPQFKLPQVDPLPEIKTTPGQLTIYQRPGSPRLKASPGGERATTISSVETDVLRKGMPDRWKTNTHTGEQTPPPNPLGVIAYARGNTLQEKLRIASAEHLNRRSGLADEFKGDPDADPLYALQEMGEVATGKHPVLAEYPESYSPSQRSALAEIYPAVQNARIEAYKSNNIASAARAPTAAGSARGLGGGSSGYGVRKAHEPVVPTRSAATPGIPAAWIERRQAQQRLDRRTPTQAKSQLTPDEMAELKAHNIRAREMLAILSGKVPPPRVTAAGAVTSVASEAARVSPLDRLLSRWAEKAAGQPVSKDGPLQQALDDLDAALERQQVKHGKLTGQARYDQLKPGQAVVSLEINGKPEFVTLSRKAIEEAGGDPIAALAAKHRTNLLGQPGKRLYDDIELGSAQVVHHKPYEAPVEKPVSAPKREIVRGEVLDDDGNWVVESRYRDTGELVEESAGAAAPAVVASEATPAAAAVTGKTTTRMTTKDGRVIDLEYDKVPANWKQKLLEQAYPKEEGYTIKVTKSSGRVSGSVKVFDKDNKAVDHGVMFEQVKVKTAAEPVKREFRAPGEKRYTVEGSGPGLVIAQDKAIVAARRTRRATKAQTAAIPPKFTQVYVTEKGYVVAEQLGRKGQIRVIDREGNILQGSVEARREFGEASREYTRYKTARQGKEIAEAEEAGKSLTPRQYSQRQRRADTSLDSALQDLGVTSLMERGLGFGTRGIKNTFGVTTLQADALSRLWYPKVRQLHQQFATEGWTPAKLKAEVTKTIRKSAEEDLGYTAAEAAEKAKLAWEMIVAARAKSTMKGAQSGGAAAFNMGPREQARIFIQAFLEPRQAKTGKIATTNVVRDKSVPVVDGVVTYKELPVFTDEWVLSNNALVRTAATSVYGALKRLDRPEAYGGAGNIPNRVLRRKINFELREIKRINDDFENAGMADEARKASQLEKQADRQTGAQPSIALRALDTMNMVSIIGMLFLKPAYVSANLIGQAMFMMADHSLNPINIHRSMKLQREYFAGAAKGASEAERALTAARVQRIEGGMGIHSGGGIMSSAEVPGYGLSRRVAATHHKLSNIAARSPSIKDRRVGLGLDTPWRDNAFFNEAIRRGFDTPAKIDQLLDAEAGTGLAKVRTEVFRRANRNMVDYGRLNDLEQKVVKRIVFFYPWMKGATVYGARFAAEHPGQLMALSAMTSGTKEKQRQELGMLPSYTEGVWKVGSRVIPGLGKQPTVFNPASISTLGTAGEAIQMAKGVIGGRARQSELLANVLSPAASIALAAGTHIDPFTGQQIPPDKAGLLNITWDIGGKTVAPLRMWSQIQQAEDIKKGNKDPAELLLPMTSSEAFGRWLGPGFGVASGVLDTAAGKMLGYKGDAKAHPMADYTLNTREARSRAAAEARALSSKADSKIMLYKDYRQQVKLEAAKLKINVDKSFDVALALKAQREAAKAIWAAQNGKSQNKLNSFERLESDMGLLVRMKKISQKDAKQILQSYLGGSEKQIDSYRRDLGEAYFGATTLSAWRKLLTDSGAKLPAF